MENNYPFISAKCITYGRVDTLEESIESFLKQDYLGKKELIIVNDYPEQTLVYDHPEVFIYNIPKTFDTIGAKENFAVNLCRGDIIAVWDDDDIAMPNHLCNIAKYFLPNTDLLHWEKGILFNDKKISAITGLGNSGIVYSKNIWEKGGGHALENAGYDMTIVLKIRSQSNNIVLAAPLDCDVSWFYMWGGRSYHMSGQGTDDETKPNILIRHSEHIENLRSQGLIPTGVITLSPKWNLDYQSLLKQYLNGE